jgi:cytochrome c oxidase assembly protein subunit 15
MKLQPIIVVTHLLLAMALLASLICSGRATNRRMSWRPGGFAALGRPAGPRAAGVQIFLGGWVSTNYAVLACTDFPLCNGQLVPEMDFRHGFTLWRQLGMTADGDYIPHAALVAIHWVHRGFAFVVLGYLVCLRARAGWKGWRGTRGGCWRAGAATGTGMSNIVFDWPLVAAVAHNGGAALLLMLLLRLNYNIGLATRSAGAAATLDCRARHMKDKMPPWLLLPTPNPPWADYATWPANTPR